MTKKRREKAQIVPTKIEKELIEPIKDYRFYEEYKQGKNHKGKGEPIKRFKEYELLSFLTEILQKSGKYRDIRIDTVISDEIMHRVDVVCKEIIGSKSNIYIEVKSSSTFTSNRYNELIKFWESQLGRREKLILFFPGVLSQYNKSSQKVILWDRIAFAKKFEKEIQTSSFPLLKEFYLSPKEEESEAKDLIDELNKIVPGKDNWIHYQRHLEKILSFLFSDILSDPIPELPDREKSNRRDYIIRNYSDESFWKFLRERYMADYLLFEAKNYNKRISKNEVLQVRNYLKEYGLGKFGIIISRSGEETPAAYQIRREAWIDDKKIIILLNDEDIENMILEKKETRQVDTIFKQKIEEFRLLL